MKSVKRRTGRNRSGRLVQEGGAVDRCETRDFSSTAVLDEDLAPWKQLRAGHVEVVRLLLKAGVQTRNLKDAHGKPPS